MFWSTEKFSALTKDEFIVRSLQVSGTCYAHAAVVLQHYLVVRSSGVPSFLKVDIARYLAMLRGNRLKDYLLGGGGNTLELLRDITGRQDLSTVRDCLPFNDPTVHGAFEANLERSLAMQRHLQAYGPALVMQFRVSQPFGTRESDSYLDGSTRVVPCGLHSMLLIGCRVDSTHGVVFLLQNWWEDNELVEVSMGYFARCEPTVVFVAEELRSIPDRFHLSCSAVTETYVDRACCVLKES